jgi:malonate-semialdehyde dehydrogenase (acetylating)/methylmalonate-semialdehyde dehydrogenase
MNKPATKETVLPREISHFVNGKEVNGTSDRFGDVYNPALGEVASRVAFATEAEVTAAIEAAHKLFPPGPPRRP